MAEEPGSPPTFAIAGLKAKLDDPSNDPAQADKWGKEREVRADLIRWLCVDPRAKALSSSSGIADARTWKWFREYRD